MKLLPGLLFLLLSIAVSAQTVDVSNPYKLPSKTSKFKIIGKNNDGIVVRLFGTEDMVDVFDENLKLQTNRTIDFKNMTGLSQYIMLNKNGAVIFYLLQDRKYSVLFAQPVNSKFIEIGKPIVIDTIFDRKDMVASNLRFKASVDQSNLMIYYPFFSGSTIESVKFICLDRSLKTLYNKQYAFNRSDKELEESKSFVDNNGNEYLILKPESRGENTTYDVYRVGSGGELNTYSISTDKALFGEASIELDNKGGNLILSSFYNDNKHIEEVANGFVYATFDPANGTPLKSSYTPFAKGFITELTGRESNDKPRLYTFVIRKAILRNDGGVLIVAESFIRDTRETPISVGVQPGFPSYRSTAIFQFNDIIAFSINSKAEVEWHSVMRKKQASEDDYGTYSSFITMNEKDKLHFLYLDDISTAGTLSEYSLTSDGKSTRSILLNQDEKDVMLLTKNGKQIAPNEIIIPSYLGGTFRLVKVTY